MAKRKIPIYIDVENLVVDHFSGIGHYTADLLKAMDDLVKNESKFKVYLGAYFRRIGLLGRFEFKNFRFKRFPFPLRVSNMLKIKGLQPPIDLIRGKKIYLYPNYTSWPMLFSKSIPFIYDLSFIKHAGYVEPRNQKFLAEQVSKSIKRASKVLTISENSKREIMEHYDVSPNDIFICYPAVDTRKFYRRSEKEVRYIKAKYGVFGNYILFVGNIEPRKNLKGLLLAYKKLPKEIREEHGLLLVGAKGWLDDEISDLIIELRMSGNKIIQPTQYVEDEDLPAIYSGASLFAYVSLYEGFGIPPLEAMACGTPVVSSDNSSLPEAVGDAAIKVDAKSTAQIAAGIEKVLKDKKFRGDLVEKGYGQVDKFSYSESAKVLLKNIEEIA
jgi:glycosyltransferase involved in cell wall biosynthesis